MSTFIQSVSATSGFLQQCKVDFARGLTCIIGARGTCKSTLLESIRFAFDCNSERVRALVAENPGRPDPWSGMIRATLGAGTIRCEVASENGSGTTSLLIERDVGNAPRVFQDGIREHADRDILHHIEIFSQGDLQRIAEDKNDELRIALIDRPNAKRIGELQSDRRQLTEALTTIGPTLRTLRTTIQTLRQELQPAAALRDDLRRVTEACPPLPVELERERDLFERRRRILEALEEGERLRKAALEQLSSLKDVTTRLSSVATRIRSETIIDARRAVDVVSSLESSFETLRTGARALAAADVAAVQQLLRTDYARARAC